MKKSQVNAQLMHQRVSRRTYAPSGAKGATRTFHNGFRQPDASCCARGASQHMHNNRCLKVDMHHTAVNHQVLRYHISHTTMLHTSHMIMLRTVVLVCTCKKEVSRHTCTSRCSCCPAQKMLCFNSIPEALSHCMGVHGRQHEMLRTPWIQRVLPRHANGAKKHMPYQAGRVQTNLLPLHPNQAMDPTAGNGPTRSSSNISNSQHETAVTAQKMLCVNSIPEALSHCMGDSIRTATSQAIQLPTTAPYSTTTRLTRDSSRNGGACSSVSFCCWINPNFKFSSMK